MRTVLSGRPLAGANKRRKLVLTPVAVEKLHFLQNSKNLGDRKCLGKLRKSFVGHPDTILFSRISRERVFQHRQAITVRREKALVHSGRKDPPGNWIAPPGSNRSGGGGNKAAGASGGEGRIRRLGESAGCNVSER